MTCCFKEKAFFWSDEIYGGHPIFAEGQLGILNPFKTISLLIFNPIDAHSFCHVLTMFMLGFGVFALARQHGLSYISSAFAMFAAVFSSGLIGGHTNITYSFAVAWMPYVLIGFEYWKSNRNIKSALWFGLSVAMSIFMGYPHILHGLIIFMAATLILEIFNSNFRKDYLEHFKRYILTGAIAVFLAITLSLVQVLPLLELAGRIS